MHPVPRLPVDTKDDVALPVLIQIPVVSQIGKIHQRKMKIGLVGHKVT